MEYTQEPLFYTAEDVVAKVTEALNAAYADADLRVQRAKDNSSFAHANVVETVLKEHIKADTITAEVASSIYNDIASQAGWTSTANFNTKLWTVVVSYNGDEIGEVEDVEAETAEEAVDICQSDTSVWSVSAEVEFSINGTRMDYQADSLEYDLGDHFVDGVEFEAREQE